MPSPAQPALLLPECRAPMMLKSRLAIVDDASDPRGGARGRVRVWHRGDGGAARRRAGHPRTGARAGAAGWWRPRRLRSVRARVERPLRHLDRCNTRRKSPPGVSAISATRRARLYLITPKKAIQIAATGGVPSLERSIGDQEVSGAFRLDRRARRRTVGSARQPATCCARWTGFIRSRNRARHRLRGRSGCTSTAAPVTAAFAST